MYGFEYYAPTHIVFGEDTEKRVAELVKESGKSRVLIHYGGESACRSGLIDRVEKALDAAGIYHVSLGGVQPNPRVTKVREGIALGVAHQIDFLLAVGGGSVIDSAKAIAYGMSTPDQEVWELFERKRKPAACLPLGVILTIAAAGSEMSNSCVITNEETHEKRSCNNNMARPRFAIMNPALTITLPPYQTQAGCVDIMMHTLERYFTQGGNMELTDAIAEGLLRTVIKNARILKDQPQNYEARAEVMWAGSLSHNGLTGCGTDGGDFVCHSLQHELGAMFDVTHGAGLSAVWPSWARYVYRDCLPRFHRFAVEVMGISAELGSPEEVALLGIAALEAVFREIGMPVNLHELGVKAGEEEIHAMAASCARINGGHRGSAKVLYEEDFAAIYRMAAEEK